MLLIVAQRALALRFSTTSRNPHRNRLPFEASLDQQSDVLRREGPTPDQRGDGKQATACKPRKAEDGELAGDSKAYGQQRTRYHEEPCADHQAAGQKFKQ